VSALRGYDAWVTREPPEPAEPPVYRCCGCGGFLPEKADGEREYVTVHRCDGQPKVLTGQRHEESVLAIIGEEHRDDTFTICYPPPCGGKTVTHEPDGDRSEIREDEVESYRHEPHFFMADGYDHYAAAVRVCRRCGCSNEDPVF
jgi:hypothetical protein